MNLDSKKQRHHFAYKGPYSQSYCFSTSPVPVWELDHKKPGVLRFMGSQKVGHDWVTEQNYTYYVYGLDSLFCLKKYFKFRVENPT